MTFGIKKNDNIYFILTFAQFLLQPKISTLHVKTLKSVWKLQEFAFCTAGSKGGSR